MPGGYWPAGPGYWPGFGPLGPPGGGVGVWPHWGAPPAGARPGLGAVVGVPAPVTGVGPVEAVAAPGVHWLFQSYCFGCGRWNRPCGRSIRSIVSDRSGSLGGDWPGCWLLGGGGGGHAERLSAGGGGGVGPPDGGGAERNWWPIAGDCAVTAGG